MSRIELLVVSWVVLPACLVLAFWGLGYLILHRLSGPPPVSRLVVGSFSFVAISWLFTAGSATIWLTILLAVLAVGGGIYALVRRAQRPRSPALLVAGATYACYAAPFVFSLQPTWAGWIKLDDTASFLAVTNRIMDAGREPVLAPVSTYDLVVSQIASGLYDVEAVSSYPTGAFTPLGVLGALSRVDLAWLFQPFMALLCAILAVGLFYLLRRLSRRAWVPAFLAVVSAQAALLYGYFQWGGVKEVALPPLLACVALMASATLDRPAEWKRWLLFLLSCVAFLTASGPSGAPYVLAPLAGVCVVLAYRSGGSRFAWLRRYRAYFVAGAALVALATVFVPGFPGVASLVPKVPNIGNLITPLEPAQAAGIWPVGDFRLVPDRSGLVAVVLLLTVVLAGAGLVFSVRRREWGLPLVVVPSLMVLGRAITDDQAWLAGKAMAVASPFVLASAFAGILWLIELASLGRARRTEVGVLLRVGAALATIVLVAGVVVSNALANREVWLAPFDENRELERIGQRFDGQGPTLVTNDAIFATRHFLRTLQAESPAELRTRSLKLRNEAEASGSEAIDATGLQDRELDPFQLIVQGRSPSASVPPPPFVLAYTGRFYDVWRRDPAAPVTEELLPLGTGSDAGALGECSKIEALGQRAGSGGELAYAERSRNALVPLNPLPGRGTEWPPGKIPGSVLPVGGGSVARAFSTSRAGSYTFWVLGSFPGRLVVDVDGREIFSGSSVIATGDASAYPLSVERLAAGAHRLTVKYSKPLLLPGSDARVAVADSVTGQRLKSDPPSGLLSLGPLVVQPGTPETPKVRTIPASQASSLCGKRLDWVARLRR